MTYTFLTGKVILTRDPRLHEDDRSFLDDKLINNNLHWSQMGRFSFSLHVIPELEFLNNLLFRNSISGIHFVTIDFL